MRKFIGSAVIVMLAITIATADEFRANITEIKDGKLVGTKGGGKGMPGDAVTVTVTKGTAFHKATVDAADKAKVIEGDKITQEDVVKAIEEAKAKAAGGGAGKKGGGKGGKGGVNVNIITNDKGEATKVQIIQGGGGKKKKDA